VSREDLQSHEESVRLIRRLKGMKVMWDEYTKLRQALEAIRFSVLSQGFAGNKRTAKEALNDVHQVASKALSESEKALEL
jgi:hypothetical protein